MLEIAILLARSAATALVKDHLTRKRALSAAGLADFSGDAAGLIVQAMLGARAADLSPHLVRIEQKLDELSVQHARSAMEFGRRLLSDADACRQEPKRRAEFLESARKAFLESASAAAPGMSRVEAELMVAGCWLALGKKDDLVRSLDCALGSCVAELLALSVAYRTVPGLELDRQSKSLVAQVIYSEVDRDLARTRIRAPLVRALKELNETFSSIWSTRSEIEPGLPALAGYVVDGKLCGLDSFPVTQKPVWQFEPCFLSTSYRLDLPGTPVRGYLEKFLWSLVPLGSPDSDDTLVSTSTLLALFSPDNSPFELIDFFSTEASHQFDSNGETIMRSYVPQKQAVIDVPLVEWSNRKLRIDSATYVSMYKVFDTTPDRMFARFQFTSSRGEARTFMTAIVFDPSTSTTVRFKR